MGRWNYGGKTEADGCKKIEISWLLRDMKNRLYKSTTISWGENGSHGSVGCIVDLYDETPYVKFNYTQTDNHTGEKKDFDYKVYLTTTPCHYGGIRYWFRCGITANGKYCGRRVGVIYKNGDYFACRHCYDLTYSSKNQNKRYKYSVLFDVLDMDQKIEKLEEKIKRRYYAGKPTRLQRKLERMYEQSGMNYRRFMDLKRNNLI